MLTCHNDAIQFGGRGEEGGNKFFFFFNNQPDALIIPILFCHKTLHVSGIFSAHHQELSTVHSALVSFMQVLMTVSKQSQDKTVPS